MTRRLRRGSRACSPMGRSHFSFGGERKVCKRKPAARRLREKALYCPFWRRGSLCRAQHGWLAYAYHRARSELAFFPPSKWAGLFPSAAYRRSAPAQLAVGKLTPCKLRCFVVAGRFCGVDKWADFLFPAVGVGQAYPLRVEIMPVAWRSCSAKYEGFCFRRSRRGAGLPHARPASHEACRRMAV